MSHKSKRLRLGATALVALTAVFAAVYAWWWSELADRARNEAVHWVQQHNMAGASASTGEIAVSGFPLKVRLVAPSPKIGWSGGWSWDGPALTAEIAPWAPGDIRLSAPGKHRFEHNGQAFALDSQTADATIAYDLNGVRKASLTLTGASSGGWRAERVQASATPLTPIQEAGPETPVLSASLSFSGLNLPDEIQSPLGRGPASAAVTATWKGAIQLPLKHDSLETWRSGGGTVEIDKLAVEWTPLTLAGTATVALDRDLQPEASGTAEIRGLMESLDKLVTGGQMRPKDAAIARMVLGVLGKPGADGVRQWSIPVAIQNRVLYAGPAAVATLPKVDW